VKWVNYGEKAFSKINFSRVKAKSKSIKKKNFYKVIFFLKGQINNIWEMWWVMWILQA
jgi:hypothetical protein